MADISFSVTGSSGTSGLGTVVASQTSVTGLISFATTSTSTTVTVSHASHGAVTGSSVIFSNVTFGSSSSYDSLVTLLTGEFVITVLGINDYTVTLSSNAGFDLVASGTSDADYLLNKGSVSQLLGTGWGADTWGAGGWGLAASDAITLDEGLRIWKQDNFGEDLILLPKNGQLYYWDKTTGLTDRAFPFLSRTPDAPTANRNVLVSDRDRHVIVFGTTPIGSTTLDPLLIRFSSQEDPFDWFPTSTNTAGDLRVGSGSEIVAAIETRREIIVITDTSVHSLQFIGAPFTFGISQVSGNITIRNTNAAIANNDTVFWMGVDRFYLYDGRVQPIPCTVKDYVFEDFDSTNSEKVVAGLNTSYGEVIWFYPSASGNTGENDRYVIYNYEEKVWYYGNLARSAWLDRGIYEYPFAATNESDSVSASTLYRHEVGNNADDLALTAFIDSSPIDIADGEQFALIRRFIPDIDFSSSTTGATKEATYTLKGQRYPGTGFTTNDAFTVSSTTEQKNSRVRGRSFGIKVQSSGSGVAWRLGSNRVDVKTDGRR